MKTIKDAIQASSIEQRRRILNNIGIDKDSKNFIVSGKASQANGGGSTGYVQYYLIKDYNDGIKDVIKEMYCGIRYFNGEYTSYRPLISEDIIPDALCYHMMVIGTTDDGYVEVIKNFKNILESKGIDASCVEEITEEEYYKPIIEYPKKNEY